MCGIGFALHRLMQQLVNTPADVVSTNRLIDGPCALIRAGLKRRLRYHKERLIPVDSLYDNGKRSDD